MIHSSEPQWSSLAHAFLLGLSPRSSERKPGKYFVWALTPEECPSPPEAIAFSSNCQPGQASRPPAPRMGDLAGTHTHEQLGWGRGLRCGRTEPTDPTLGSKGAPSVPGLSCAILPQITLSTALSCGIVPVSQMRKKAQGAEGGNAPRSWTCLPALDLRSWVRSMPFPRLSVPLPVKWG